MEESYLVSDAMNDIIFLLLARLGTVYAMEVGGKDRNRSAREHRSRFYGAISHETFDGWNIYTDNQTPHFFEMVLAPTSHVDR